MSTSANTPFLFVAVKGPFNVGGHSIESDLIICKNLFRSLILGLDFMQKHHIGLRWSDTGKGLLTKGGNILIEIIHFSKAGPCILTQTTINL